MEANATLIEANMNTAIDPIEANSKAAERARRTARTLERAQLQNGVVDDNALLRFEAVQALSGFGRSKLYELIKSGALTPIKLSRRCTRYRAGQVRAWLAALGSEQ